MGVEEQIDPCSSQLRTKLICIYKTYLWIHCVILCFILFIFDVNEADYQI